MPTAAAGLPKERLQIVLRSEGSAELWNAVQRDRKLPLWTPAKEICTVHDRSRVSDMFDFDAADCSHFLSGYETVQVSRTSYYFSFRLLIFRCDNLPRWVCNWRPGCVHFSWFAFRQP